MQRDTVITVVGAMLLATISFVFGTVVASHEPVDKDQDNINIRVDRNVQLDDGRVTVWPWVDIKWDKD